MQIEFIDDLNLKVIVESEIYGSDIIHKCFYWYTKNYSIDISQKLDKIEVLIGGISLNENKEELVTKIKRDVIDFKTRDIISKETKNIRELLIAKAFSNNDEFDSSPPGDINDSIGFDITKL